MLGDFSSEGPGFLVIIPPSAQTYEKKGLDGVGPYKLPLEMLLRWRRIESRVA
jgi:hypothetical protein